MSVYLSMMVPLVARRESTGTTSRRAGKGSSPADRSVGVLSCRSTPKSSSTSDPALADAQPDGETLLVRRDGHDALSSTNLSSRPTPPSNSVLLWTERTRRR